MSSFFIERSHCVSISMLGILSGMSGSLGGGCSSVSGIAGLGYSGAVVVSDLGLTELSREDGFGLGSISVRLSFDSTTPSKESFLGPSSLSISSLGEASYLSLGLGHGIFNGVERDEGLNVGGFGALGSSYGFEPSHDSGVSYLLPFFGFLGAALLSLLVGLPFGLGVDRFIEEGFASSAFTKRMRSARLKLSCVDDAVVRVAYPCA